MPPAPAKRARVSDPNPVPTDAERPPPPYPRSFVDRPILLPPGVREISVSSTVGRETLGDLRGDYLGLGGGAGFGYHGFELDLGVQLVPLYDANVEGAEAPLFQRLLASVSWSLPEDWYLAVQGVVGNVGNRRQRYSPSITVGHRFRIHEKVVLFTSGGVDYNRGREVTYYDQTYVNHRFSAFGGGTLRLQATPEVAFQLGGSYAISKLYDMTLFERSTSYHGISGRAAMLISASDDIDVAPFFSVSSVLDLDTYSVGLSVTVR